MGTTQKLIDALGAWTPVDEHRATMERRNFASNTRASVLNELERERLESLAVLDWRAARGN
jgi:hypothetical protein